MILLNVLAHNLDKFLHTFLEVGVNVIHHTTNRVVVQYQAAATSFLKYVEYFLAVAESIKEGGCGTKVLAETAKKQDVRVNTLQLVHDGTNYLHTIAHLNAHGLFNTHAQRMTVLHGTKVIQAVCQSQSLRIGHAFANFLHTTVNITEYRVDLANHFTLKVYTEVKHTVS